MFKIISDGALMKKATNLSVDEELLKEAKALDINLSQTLEEALRKLIRHRQAESWKAKNRDAIESYDEHIDKHGVFSDKLRSF